MIGPVHGRRWIAGGRSVFTTGATAAVAVAAVAAVWPVSGSLAATRSLASARPASHAARRGWEPVPFEAAQLSVPGQWLVESRTSLFCPGPHEGTIFAGIKPRFPKNSTCRLSASFAWIIRGSRTAPAHRKPTLVIAGFPVYRLPGAKHSVLYLVPKLGVRIGAHGPKAGQILTTLRQSPLATVLAKGQLSKVPANWVSRTFGGIKFATPRGWHTEHKNQWETCGTGVDPRSLLLINAKKPSVPLPCPLTIPTAKNLAAVQGVTAVIGKHAAQSVRESYPNCLPRQGTKICLSSVTGAGGFYSAVLIFSVSRPHHRPAGFFLVGLTGTGAQARAIFDSISVR